MKVINQKAHIDENGILKLNISTHLKESDVELVVVINQLNEDNFLKLSEEDIQMVEERWEEYKRNPQKSFSWQQIKDSIIKKNEL